MVSLLSNGELLEKIEASRARQKELEKAVQRLIEQARDRDIGDKAFKVARILGVADEKGDCYNNGSLMVIYEFSPERIGIFYNDKRVFAYQHQHITTYRPDIEGWENALKEAFDTTEKREREVQAEREKNALLEFMDDWGLEAKEYRDVSWDAMKYKDEDAPTKVEREPAKFGPKFSYAHPTR